jgi:hypothetical protein
MTTFFRNRYVLSIWNLANTVTSALIIFFTPRLVSVLTLCLSLLFFSTFSFCPNAVPVSALLGFCFWQFLQIVT